MLTPRASTISERLCEKPSAVFNPLKTQDREKDSSENPRLDAPHVRSCVSYGPLDHLGDNTKALHENRVIS